MAALTQARTIAGCKAFTGIRPRRVAAVSNGSKYFMRRKDSYMVEVRQPAPLDRGGVGRGATCVAQHSGSPDPAAGGAQVNVGEEEPEDIAVRRFMKSVMQTKVVEQVRGAARRTARRSGRRQPGLLAARDGR
jgi:hypothetical protein